jgi:hypothetical protein
MRSKESFMRLRFVVSAIFFSLPVISLHAQQAQPAPVAPVVIELFTAEGCSSCPPADELVAKLVELSGGENPQVIALGEHVDYWNKDGWTDRFSSAAFTARQNEYVSRFKLESAFTPQIVIDGSSQFSGNDRANVVHSIQAAAAKPLPAQVDLKWESPTRLHIAVQSKDSAQVLLAVTEDDLKTDVGRGENKGRTLQHVGVVRQLREIGNVSKDAFEKSVDVPIQSGWNKDKLKVVVLVQSKKQGPIVGAASTSYPAPSGSAGR